MVGIVFSNTWMLAFKTSISLIQSIKPCFPRKGNGIYSDENGGGNGVRYRGVGKRGVREGIWGWADNTRSQLGKGHMKTYYSRSFFKIYI